MGRENVKNIQKTNEICYCLGGKFTPLKALKKKTLGIKATYIVSGDKGQSHASTYYDQYIKT